MGAIAGQVAAEQGTSAGRLGRRAGGAQQGTSAGRSPGGGCLYSRWPRGAEGRCWRGHFPGNLAPSPPERGLRYFRMKFTLVWRGGPTSLAPAAVTQEFPN